MEIDSVQPGPRLAAIIGFYFAFRVFLVALTNWAIGLDPEIGVELMLGLNFALFTAAVFTCLGTQRNHESNLLSLPPVRWVLFFLIFTGSSLLWTVAASLPAAAIYWCSMAADSAMVALLLRKYSADEVADAMMRGIVWGSCLFAAIAWFSPSQEDNRLGYDLLGTNQIGFACAFGLFAAQFLAVRKRGKWTWAIVLLAVTLLRSLSKTTIIALLAGEVFFMLRERSISRRTKVFAIAGTLLLVLVSWNFLAAYLALYSDNNQAENLTGRLGIWTYMLNEAVEKPWVGHGFHSVWKVIPPFPPDDFEARHAHNELIQQIYAYGAAGVVMLAGLYVSFFRHVRKTASGPLRTFLFSLLIFVVIRGFADTDAFDLTLPVWLIILFSALTVSQKGELQLPAPATVETKVIFDSSAVTPPLAASN